MSRSAKLDTDMLVVESFVISPMAVALSLEADGTWNDATAGCCRPKPDEGTQFLIMCTITSGGIC